jgi:hypothetical protein
MADFGIGDLQAGRIREGNRPGYFDLKLCGESSSKTGKKRFEVGCDCEGAVQNDFVKLQYCKPDPIISP